MNVLKSVLSVMGLSEDTLKKAQELGDVLKKSGADATQKSNVKDDDEMFEDADEKKKQKKKQKDDNKKDSKKSDNNNSQEQEEGNEQETDEVIEDGSIKSEAGDEYIQKEVEKLINSALEKAVKEIKQEFKSEVEKIVKSNTEKIDKIGDFVKSLVEDIAKSSQDANAKSVLAKSDARKNSDVIDYNKNKQIIYSLIKSNTISPIEVAKAETHLEYTGKLPDGIYELAKSQNLL